MRADLEADYMLGSDGTTAAATIDGRTHRWTRPVKARRGRHAACAVDRAHGVATDEFDGTAMV
jgi:hypothetical protein